ncbi:MAG TPA: IS4 family transposase [Segetibacter sp.]
MNHGKYVFAQIFDLVKSYDFHNCVKLYKGDYRLKTFKCWEQFLVMSFAQFSFRESLRDIEFCLASVQPKLYHCGIRSVVPKSTIADANERRDYRIYADFAKTLMQAAIPLYKGENALSKELGSLIYAFDSTTIDLCLNLFPWATFRKTKSAVKMHVLLNVEGSIPEFVTITKGHVQDVTMLDEISFTAGAFYLVDKAYVDFERLYRIETSKANFVTRAKENMSYDVEQENAINNKETIIKDELVKLKRWHTRRWYPIPIRRIEFIDPDTALELTFLTNNLKLEAEIIARLYKERWRVELFFKWIKQNLRIKKFYGYSDNAVKTQLWIAVCDYLIIAILKKNLNTELTLNQMLQILSISLFEKVDIRQLFGIPVSQETKDISKQGLLFENLTGQ